MLMEVLVHCKVITAPQYMSRVASQYKSRKLQQQLELVIIPIRLALRGDGGLSSWNYYLL